MPYIKPEDRAKFEENHLYGAGLNCSTAGELNYCISQIIAGYISNKGKNYQHMNDALGALHAAGLEFNRRIVAPYEDTKIQENGDIAYKLIE
jgi:hypothetical protein